MSYGVKMRYTETRRRRSGVTCSPCARGHAQRVLKNQPPPVRQVGGDRAQKNKNKNQAHRPRHWI